MYSTSTGAAVEKAPEPELEQHFYRRVLRSRSSIFINDSSGAGAGAASDFWLLRSPGYKDPPVLIVLPKIMIENAGKRRFRLTDLNVWT